ncbi:MAG: molybdopterin-dependent oxidoreductase [Deltaproteobacteria bacterium]|nr:molybdopterin-dependent oxidoreductase [Deltaproteobacteria bacterium]
MASFRVVGQSVSRVEGRAKVTGEGQYPADVQLPDMLWAKVLRSPLPHARIRSIDASRARRLEGVHAVLTAEDVPDILIGRMLRDMPLLARDRVRFVGEKVAVVAADTRDIAEEALSLIDVQYEELPAVFDPYEALESNAPILHENLDSYQCGSFPLWSRDYPRTVEGPTNHFSCWTVAKGDIEEGFSQADRIFEHQFTLPMAHQAYLEPYACVVQVDGSGRIQIWANNKQPHSLRKLLSEFFELDPQRILIHVTFIGGDFGGKSSPMDVPLIYCVAKATGRPVKMVMNYEEEFQASNPRHPASITIRSGIKKDGTLVARHGRVVFNCGAYAAFKPNGSISGGYGVGGCYRIPHVLLQIDNVYTNTVPRGHSRAPGSPQATFAVESHMDMIAKELEMDPLEFRLKNVLQEGDRAPNGHQWHEIKAEPTLRAAAKALNWGSRKTSRYTGRGLALFHHPTGVGSSSATINLEKNGTVTVYSPTFDHGTGIHTIVSQIVAEELTLSSEQVRIVTIDTDRSTPDNGVGNSRTTHTAGQAALRTVRELREKLLVQAAEVLDCGKEAVKLEKGRFVSPGKRSIGLAELAKQAVDRNTPITAYGEYKSNAREITSFCTQGAEVEVDPESGHVQVRRIVSAVDTGTIINPITFEGQVEGGLITGLGYALMEEMPVEDGKVSTLNFGDYKIPSIRDVPKHRPIYLEEPSGPTPYQGKSIGETTNPPVAGAIANAIADAVGARVTSLPLTAEKILKAIKEQH